MLPLRLICFILVSHPTRESEDIITFLIYFTIKCMRIAFYYLFNLQVFLEKTVWQNTFRFNPANRRLILRWSRRDCNESRRNHLNIRTTIKTKRQYSCYMVTLLQWNNELLYDLLLQRLKILSQNNSDGSLTFKRRRRVFCFSSKTIKALWNFNFS